VHFTFTPPTDTGNQAQLEYELLVDGPDLAGVRATPLQPSGNDVSGLQPGGRYCFTVVANNGVYRGSSAPSCITLSGSVTPTSTGGGLAATGTPLGVIALLGILLAAAGGILIARRRRVA